MLKFTGDGKDGKLYFLGLSRNNVDELIRGHPIKANLRDLGGPSITIAILFGETEQLLFNELKAQGLLPPEIVYRAAKVDMAEVVRIKREKKNEE